ncbi:MAG: hypothetical protein ACRDI1_03135, partial [Actinomycetota bacterium]
MKPGAIGLAGAGLLLVGTLLPAGTNATQFVDFDVTVGGFLAATIFLHWGWILTGGVVSWAILARGPQPDLVGILGGIGVTLSALYVSVLLRSLTDSGLGAEGTGLNYYVATLGAVLILVGALLARKEGTATSAGGPANSTAAIIVLAGAAIVLIGTLLDSGDDDFTFVTLSGDVETLWQVLTHWAPLAAVVWAATRERGFLRGSATGLGLAMTIYYLAALWAVATLDSTLIGPNHPVALVGAFVMLAGG